MKYQPCFFRCTLIAKHSILKIDYGNLCLWTCHCTFSTPNQKSASGAVIFVTEDDAVNFQPGAVFAR